LFLSRSSEVKQVDDLMALEVSELTPVTKKHFEAAIKAVPPSVSKEKLKTYDDWNTQQRAS
jgi:SpoVK/Ycf46/Vps4 family AAA+-type ATPase